MKVLKTIMPKYKPIGIIDKSFSSEVLSKNAAIVQGKYYGADLVHKLTPESEAAENQVSFILNLLTQIKNVNSQDAAFISNQNRIKQDLIYQLGRYLSNLSDIKNISYGDISEFKKVAAQIGVNSKNSEIEKLIIDVKKVLKKNISYRGLAQYECNFLHNIVNKAFLIKQSNNKLYSNSIVKSVSERPYIINSLFKKDAYLNNRDYKIYGLNQKLYNTEKHNSIISNIISNSITLKEQTLKTIANIHENTKAYLLENTDIKREYDFSSFITRKDNKIYRYDSENIWSDYYHDYMKRIFNARSKWAENIYFNKNAVDKYINIDNRHEVFKYLISKKAYEIFKKVYYKREALPNAHEIKNTEILTNQMTLGKLSYRMLINPVFYKMMRPISGRSLNTEYNQPEIFNKYHRFKNKIDNNNNFDVSYGNAYNSQYYINASTNKYIDIEKAILLSKAFSRKLDDKYISINNQHTAFSWLINKNTYEIIKKANKKTQILLNRYEIKNTKRLKNRKNTYNNFNGNSNNYSNQHYSEAEYNTVLTEKESYHRYTETYLYGHKVDFIKSFYNAFSLAVREENRLYRHDNEDKWINNYHDYIKRVFNVRSKRIESTYYNKNTIDKYIRIDNTHEDFGHLISERAYEIFQKVYYKREALPNAHEIKKTEILNNQMALGRLSYGILISPIFYKMTRSVLDRSLNIEYNQQRIFSKYYVFKNRKSLYNNFNENSNNNFKNQYYLETENNTVLAKNEDYHRYNKFNLFYNYSKSIEALKRIYSWPKKQLNQYSKEGKYTKAEDYIKELHKNFYIISRHIDKNFSTEVDDANYYRRTYGDAYNKEAVIRLNSLDSNILYSRHMLYHRVIQMQMPLETIISNGTKGVLSEWRFIKNYGKKSQAHENYDFKEFKKQKTVTLLNSIQILEKHSERFEKDHKRKKVINQLNLIELEKHNRNISVLNRFIYSAMLGIRKIHIVRQLLEKRMSSKALQIETLRSDIMLKKRMNSDQDIEEQKTYRLVNMELQNISKTNRDSFNNINRNLHVKNTYAERENFVLFINHLKGLIAADMDIVASKSSMKKKAAKNQILINQSAISLVEKLDKAYTHYIKAKNIDEKIQKKTRSFIENMEIEENILKYSQNAVDENNSISRAAEAPNIIYKVDKLSTEKTKEEGEHEYEAQASSVVKIKPAELRADIDNEKDDRDIDLNSIFEKVYDRIERRLRSEKRRYGV